ncbi:MAG: hypothetical protein IH870_10175 [Chloroflexi bacterium]|nr:hypothetical protein [Chloroflexota bacterium]
MGTVQRNAKLLGSILWNVLVPVTISFAIFAGGLYLFRETGSGAVAQADRYDVFKDTITIVLSVAGIIIAVLGVGAFLLLRVFLQRDITNEVNEKFLRSMIWNLINVGYTLWDHHQNTNEQFLLRHAIEVTVDAHEQVKQLDQSQLINQEIEGIVRNNWGYYLAAKAKASREGSWQDEGITHDEMQQALHIAEYLKEKARVFPHYAGSFSDTIAYIHDHCK